MIVEMGVAIDSEKFASTMKQFIGTHNMKSYSGSIQYSYINTITVVIEIKIWNSFIFELCEDLVFRIH